MLKGKKLFLRALEPADLDALYRWENDTSVWLVSNTVTPFSKYTLEQYIETANLDIYTTKQMRLMIVEGGGTSVGCIDLFDFDPNNGRAGIGVLIGDEQHRNNGYASEALDLLIPYCFNSLGLHQLYCNITVSNELSLILFKKFGFEIVGVKKQWIREGNNWADEYLLQKINS